MGERKGVNKYYPPDWDPSKGGLDKYHGTHPLRERARKLHMGILIIRFELPYNIWCGGCNNHIGMGVRYNAEKKKVGNYYSTPVYQFRMKCHLCNNYFEIKTDPANLDYVIVSGARRQENRWDPKENEQVVPEEKEVSRKLASDAMFNLEHKERDKTRNLLEAKPRLGMIKDMKRKWKDDYELNKYLRDQFRSRKKELQLKALKDSELCSRLSIQGVPLVPESEEDMKMASLISLMPAKSFDEMEKEKFDSLRHGSVFKHTLFSCSSRFSREAKAGGEEGAAGRSSAAKASLIESMTLSSATTSGFSGCKLGDTWISSSIARKPKLTTKSLGIVRRRKDGNLNKTLDSASSSSDSTCSPLPLHQNGDCHMQKDAAESDFSSTSSAESAGDIFPHSDRESSFKLTCDKGASPRQDKSDRVTARLPLVAYDDDDSFSDQSEASASVVDRSEGGADVGIT